MLCLCPLINLFYGFALIPQICQAVHHDTNLQALQMLGGLLDLGNGFAKVIERTATTRTTDILGLAGTQTGIFPYLA